MSKQSLIERERRWAVPAGITALLPVVFYIGSILIQQSANIATGDSEGDQLRSVHAHSGVVIGSSIVAAIGLALVVVPLFYLFRAAQARNPRVHGALIGFALIGPLFLAAQGVVNSTSVSKVATSYAATREPKVPYAQFQRELAQHPASIQSVTVYTTQNAVEFQRSSGQYETTTSYGKQDSAEKKLEAQLTKSEKQGVSHSDDSTGLPGDDLARHLIDDSKGLQVGQSLLFPAILGFLVGMIYIPLQATRTGLLTRFFGTLGMALGASLVILPQVSVLAILLWFAYLGLLYLGRIPGGRPPAWEAGEAIPWPKPGEEPARGRSQDGTVEGSGRELPGNGEVDGAGTQSVQPGSGRRKRKRRR